MSIEWLPFASGIGKALFPEVAKQLTTKINSALNPTDLEKALNAGVSAGDEWDNKQLKQICCS